MLMFNVLEDTRISLDEEMEEGKKQNTNIK
jgi:hypothetical protein